MLDAIRDFLRAVVDAIREALRSLRLYFFYRNHICAIIAFARGNGSDLSETDFFHCHVITDVNPKTRDEHGNLVLSEAFMLDHYRGLLGHAHEYDGQRSNTADNFNIHRRGDGPVGFAGTTEVVFANHERITPGPWPGQIHFRYWTEDAPCPPGTRRIYCRSIRRHICVGLRYRWPQGDPALGR